MHVFFALAVGTSINSFALAESFSEAQNPEDVPIDLRIRRPKDPVIAKLMQTIDAQITSALLSNRAINNKHNRKHWRPIVVRFGYGTHGEFLKPEIRLTHDRKLAEKIVGIINGLPPGPTPPPDSRDIEIECTLRQNFFDQFPDEDCDKESSQPESSPGTSGGTVTAKLVKVKRSAATGTGF